LDLTCLGCLGGAGVHPTLTCTPPAQDTLHHLYVPVWGWSDAEKRKQLAMVRAFVLLSSSGPPQALLLAWKRFSMHWPHLTRTGL